MNQYQLRASAFESKAFTRNPLMKWRLIGVIHVWSRPYGAVFMLKSLKVGHFSVMQLLLIIFSVIFSYSRSYYPFPIEWYVGYFFGHLTGIQLAYYLFWRVFFTRVFQFCSSLPYLDGDILKMVVNRMSLQSLYVLIHLMESFSENMRVLTIPHAW